MYVLRTGCQWKALPREHFGSASAIHKRFLEWEQAGFFSALWRARLAEHDEMEGIAWRWQSFDGALLKAPPARQSVGPNPTDRGKSGSKRTLLVDARGVPLSIVVTGANRHDVTQLVATLDASLVKLDRVLIDRNVIAKWHVFGRRRNLPETMSRFKPAFTLDDRPKTRSARRSASPRVVFAFCLPPEPTDGRLQSTSQKAPRRLDLGGARRRLRRHRYEPPVCGEGNVQPRPRHPPQHREHPRRTVDDLLVTDDRGVAQVRGPYHARLQQR